MQITRKVRTLLRRKTRRSAVRSAPSTRAQKAVGIVLVALVLLVAILDFSLTAHGLYGYGVHVAKLGKLSVSIPAACDALALVGVAAAFLLALARAPVHVRAYAWLVFGVGASASIAGQISFSYVEKLTWPGYVGAAFWPISLALAAHLAIVVWRWTIIMLPTSAVSAEPITASARVPGMNWWMGPDGRALLPLRCAVSLPALPVPKPKQDVPKPPHPPMPREPLSKPTGTGERLSPPTRALHAVGTVPDVPRAVAVALAKQGKTGGEIWRSWGSPDKPSKRTVEWWISEAKQKEAASGGA